jgi:hypothetical protein
MTKANVVPAKGRKSRVIRREFSRIEKFAVQKMSNAKN